MVGLAGGVGDGGEDIVALQERIVAEDFFIGGAGGEQIKDIRDADALAADARLATELARFTW